MKTLTFYVLIMLRLLIRNYREEDCFYYSEPIVIVKDTKKAPRLFSVAEIKLRYKIENRTLYVSEDGENWEVVIFRVVDDKKRVDKYDSSITIFWVIYLECKWFKGEYEIISIPNA